MFPFSFISRYFLISLLISSLAHLFRSVLFNFYIFLIYATFFLLLISSFILLWSEKILDVISIFLKICDLSYDLSWRMFHVGLRRMYILLLLLLNEMFCACLLGPISLKWSHIQCFLIDFSDWMIYLLLKMGYWHPLFILYCWLFLSSDNIFFICLFTPVLGAMLGATIYDCCIFLIN